MKLKYYYFSCNLINVLVKNNRKNLSDSNANPN
ncbi:MAG: hypothetical protein CG442_568 [Methylococcaceae bacterium NSO1]|jgi:hypothetical protein|nr:MAG: hypothetical protein CG442_568 [Methylococcaceae bacterium NSO1]